MVYAEIMWWNSHSGCICHRAFRRSESCSNVAHFVWAPWDLSIYYITTWTAQLSHSIGNGRITVNLKVFKFNFFEWKFVVCIKHWARHYDLFIQNHFQLLAFFDSEPFFVVANSVDVWIIPSLKYRLISGQNGRVILVHWSGQTKQSTFRSSAGVPDGLNGIVGNEISNRIKIKYQKIFK